MPESILNLCKSVPSVFQLSVLICALCGGIKVEITSTK